MDAKQKSLSRIDRRRKKQTKQQKDDEHLNKITDAFNTFLKTQNITPEVYNEHIVYTKTIQVNCFSIESVDKCACNCIFQLCFCYFASLVICVYFILTLNTSIGQLFWINFVLFSITETIL